MKATTTPPGWLDDAVERTLAAATLAELDSVVAHVLHTAPENARLAAEPVGPCLTPYERRDLTPHGRLHTWPNLVAACRRRLEAGGQP